MDLLANTFGHSNENTQGFPSAAVFPGTRTTMGATQLLGPILARCLKRVGGKDRKTRLTAYSYTYMVVYSKQD